MERLLFLWLLCCLSCNHTTDTVIKSEESNALDQFSNDSEDVIQDTLPSEIVKAIFESDFYKEKNRSFLKSGSLSLFVLPPSGDSLVRFQLVNNGLNRMEPVVNMGYSSKSKLLYRYDNLIDSFFVMPNI